MAGWGEVSGEEQIQHREGPQDLSGPLGDLRTLAEHRVWSSLSPLSTARPSYSLSFKPTCRSPTHRESQTPRAHVNIGSPRSRAPQPF